MRETRKNLVVCAVVVLIAVSVVYSALNGPVVNAAKVVKFDRADTVDYRIACEYLRACRSNSMKVSTEINGLYGTDVPLGGKWQPDAEYCIEMALPQDYAGEDGYSEVRLAYPRNIKAGENGIIIMSVAVKDGPSYYSVQQLTAGYDDLELVYGGRQENTDGGDVFDMYDDKVEFTVYTSATEKQRNIRQGSSIGHYAGTEGIFYVTVAEL